jgi:branched-chain amino acid transport system substrate-binding protein
MIAPVATNPNVTQGKTYVFRTCFVDSFQGAAAARYAYEKLKARTVAMLIDVSQDYAVGLAAFFSREFTRLGGKVVAQARCNSGDQDFSAQIGAIKAVSPDVFYLPNYPNEIALASRQAQELGLTTPILCGDGADAPELIKIGGEAVEGLTFTAHFDRAGAVTPRGQDFLARYGRLQAQGKVDQDLTGFHALGADAYLVLVDAIARAGSSQGPKIRQALVDTANFPGITGKISLGESGNAVKSVTVLKVAQGRFNYVTTMEP